MLKIQQFLLIFFLAGSWTHGIAEKNQVRDFKKFLPKNGDKIDDPNSQLVQVLLDRQEQGEFDSYMIQVLFHGKTTSHQEQILNDRILIDFYDCGKPAMRLAKIRGGIIEADAVEELYYKEPASSNKEYRIKKMVRLTLFIQQKPVDLKLRDTLDRTLIHFKIHHGSPEKKP